MCECRLVFLVVGVRLMVTDVRCDMWPIQWGGDGSGVASGGVATGGVS